VWKKKKVLDTFDMAISLYTGVKLERKIPANGQHPFSIKQHSKYNG